MNDPRPTDSDHDRLVRIEERQIDIAGDIREMKDCYLEIREAIHGGEGKSGLLTKVAELEQGRKANKNMIAAVWAVLVAVIGGLMAWFLSRS